MLFRILGDSRPFFWDVLRFLGILGDSPALCGVHWGFGGMLGLFLGFSGILGDSRVFLGDVLTFLGILGDSLSPSEIIFGFGGMLGHFLGCLGMLFRILGDSRPFS